MNRDGFEIFAENATGLGQQHVSEIFSCATDCFDGSDCEMTSNQFTIALVRLANLWYL